MPVVQQGEDCRRKGRGESLRAAWRNVLCPEGWSAFYGHEKRVSFDFEEHAFAE